MSDTAASWAQAGSSIIAVLTALYIAVVGWRRADQVAAEQTQSSREHEERAQASLVTWWTPSIAGPEDESGVRGFADNADYWVHGYPDLRMAVLLIRNASEECIYETTLRLPKWFYPGSEFVEEEHENGDEHRFLLRQIGVLPPRATERFLIPISADIGQTPTSGQRTRNFLPFNRHVDWVEFRDRSGILWRRLQNGDLQRQPDRPIRTETLYSN